MDQQTPQDDKILVIQCVTLVAVLCVGLSGYALWLFKADAQFATAILQVIFAAVMASITGLMGIAVGRELEKRKHDVNSSA